MGDIGCNDLNDNGLCNMVYVTYDIHIYMVGFVMLQLLRAVQPTELLLGLQAVLRQVSSVHRRVGMRHVWCLLKSGTPKPWIRILK